MDNEIKRITIEAPIELWRRLREAAEKDGRSMAKQIVHILEIETGMRAN